MTYTGVNDPQFKDEAPLQKLADDHELIGVSLTLSSAGNWLNLLSWPRGQAIV